MVNVLAIAGGAILLFLAWLVEVSIGEVAVVFVLLGFILTFVGALTSSSKPRP